jgi:hypothetical protein
MSPLAGNDPIRRDKSFSDTAFLHRPDQKCSVIATIPIQCCPSMKEVVVIIQPKFATYGLYIFAVLFAGTDAGPPAIRNLPCIGVWTFPVII